MTELQIYLCARTAWIDAQGDPEKAEALFSLPTMEQRAMALDLFQHWIDTNQSEPPVVVTREACEVLGIGEHD